MLKYFITGFLILWLLNKIYKVVFPFLHMSSAAGNRMREMQEQMNDMQRRMNEQRNQQQAPQQQATKRVKKEGDYIDYEELK